MGTTKLDARIEVIGKKLRKMRKDAGYTSYVTFSKENDIPEAPYWRLETGTNFTIETLLKVLDVHGVNLEEFFHGIK